MGVPERRIVHPVCSCEGFVSEYVERSRGRRREALTRAWEGTGVPAEYRDVTPDFERLDRIDLEGGGGLYLHGRRGTGKTHDACRVLKAYVARNASEDGWCSARFVPVLDWLDRMQDAYHKWSWSAEDEYQRAAGTGLLVLDDIGKTNSRVSDWTIGKLFRLVDDRYRSRRPTIFTSKYGLGELAERLAVDGDADKSGDMVSRIRQRCERVGYDGPDRRLGG